MKRVFTATCFAAMFAVGLAAQSTTGTTGTSTAADQGGQGRGGPRSFSGCLRAGDTTGTYMLTDVQMVAADTTAGSTAGSTAAGSTAGATGGTMGRAGQMPTTLMLTTSAADVDLKAHVGHKIEVTGSMAGGGRRGGADTAGSTAGSTTGSTTGSTSGSTAGGTGTSAAGAAAQGGARTRTLNVTAVKMVSESCS